MGPVGDCLRSEKSRLLRWSSAVFNCRLAGAEAETAVVPVAVAEAPISIITPLVKVGASIATGAGGMSAMPRFVSGAYASISGPSDVFLSA